MAVKSNKYRMKQAADRAKAKVGKANKYRYCLQECVNGSGTPYAIPGPWGWGGNGNDTAINFWLNAVAKGKVVKTSDPGKIPAGALVFMVNNADKGKAKPAGAGHVFIGAGGGYAYSTDRPSNGHWGRVTIKSIEQAWGKTLVGYVLITGDGYDLQDKLVVTEKDNRWETTASLLNLRAAPVDGKVLAQVKRGTIIDTVGYAPVQGSVWQVDAEQRWVSKEYLKEIELPPELPASSCTFIAAFANLEGGYDDKDKNWGKRKQAVADKLSAVGFAICGVTELHEENDMGLDFMKLMKAPYVLNVGDTAHPDGNGLIIDPTAFEVTGVTSHTLYGARNATVFAITERASKSEVCAVVTHFTANDPIVRAVQGAQLRAILDKLDKPYFVLGDLNNDSVYAGSPLAVLALPTLADHGPIVNGEYNSHHPGKGGKHIDHILPSPEFVVTDARFVLTGGTKPELTDHNWPVTTLTLLEAP